MKKVATPKENFNASDLYLRATEKHLDKIRERHYLIDDGKKIILEISVDNGCITRLDNSKIYHFRTPVRTNNRFNYLLQISRENTPISKLGNGKSYSYISQEIRKINEKLKETLNLIEDPIININGNSGYEINKLFYEVKLL